MKFIFYSGLIIACAFISLSVAQAAPTSTPTLEAVKNNINQQAFSLRGWLKNKRAQLEQEIAELETRENAVTQTPEGQQINQAVGDNSFVPATKPTGRPIDTVTRIFKQLYLLLIIIAIYILDHPLILYIVLACLAFIILRYFFRWLLRRA